MPISTSHPPAPSSKTGRTTSFVVYLSSVDDETGVMWCPDCVKAMPLLASLLDDPRGPDVHIAYVGSKPSWKSPDSEFRHPPYSLKAVPTIVKLEDGVETDRLADPEFHEEGRLRAFVLGDEEAEAKKKGEAAAAVKPLAMLGGGAGKTCNDEMCF